MYFNITNTSYALLLYMFSIFQTLWLHLRVSAYVSYPLISCCVPNPTYIPSHSNNNGESSTNSSSCNFVLFWCDFDRASSLICGNKMPTRCNRGFYCRSYCLLNMFRAPLCLSSGAQAYYTVVAACGISCCGFQVAGLVWSWGLCPFCRMLQHPANRTHNPQLHTRPATWKTTAKNTTRSNHCIILLSSWWWA